MIVAGSMEIQLLTGMSRLHGDMRTVQSTVQGAMGRVEQSVSRADRSMQELVKTAQSMRGVLGTLVAGLGVRELIGLTDQYTKFSSQLRLAAGGAAAYANAMSEVRRISTAAQSDIAATGTLFARIRNATAELGIGQAKVADITETVSLALRASGATAQEASSAMIQLSQAFGSGVLRGEEFNAVNEAAPRLMKALADGMGVPIGALRQMATEGKITSAVLAEALPKALGELRVEAAQIQTISGAFTLLKNATMEFVGTQAQASGAVQALTTAIAAVADNLGLLTAAAIGYGAAKLASVILQTADAARIGAVALMEQAAMTNLQRDASIAHAAGIAQSTAAQLAQLKATEAGILASRAEVVARMQAAHAALEQARVQAQAAASAGALSFAIAVKREAELAATAATKLHSVAVTELAILGQQQARVAAQITAATVAQTAAQTALTAATTAGGAAAGMATRLIGFLGGPIGVVTTLLGLGVTAWMAWGAAAKSQEAQAAQAVERSTGEILEDLNKQIAKLRERNALAAAGLPGVARDGGDAAAKLAKLQAQMAAAEAGTGEFANLPEVARLDVLRKLTLQYGQLAGAIATVKEEQKKLDSNGQAATDLIEVRQRLAGVNKQYLEDLGKFQAALKAGAITEAEYIRDVSELARQTYEKSKAGRAAEKADNKALKEAAKEAREEEQERIKFGRARVIEQVKAMHDGWAAEKKMLDERSTALKALREEELRRIDAYEKSVAAGAEQNKAMQEEVNTIGLTTQQLAEYQIAKNNSTIAIKEEQLARMQNGEFMSREAIALAEEVRLLKERNGLLSRRAARETQLEHVRELQRILESVDRTAQEVWTNVFEGGSDAFKRLGQALKAAVLDLLYQLTIRPFVINVTANILGGATGQAASSILGNAGSNIFSTASNALGITGPGSVVDTALGAFGMGSGIGGAAITGAEIAATAEATSLMLAEAGATAAEAAIAAEALAGTMTTATGTITAALAAVPVVGWIAAAAVALYSIFGGKGGGPKVDGVFGRVHSDIGIGGTHAAANETAAITAAGLQKQFDDIVKAAGGSSNLKFGVGISSDPRGSAPTFLDVTASRDGQTAFTSLDRDVGRSEQELQAAIAKMASVSILKGLQQANLEGQIGDWLKSLGDIDSLSGGALDRAIAHVNLYVTQRAALEERIFQATATEAEKAARERQREIDAIVAGNEAILARTQALEAEKIAAQKMAGIWDKVIGVGPGFLSEEQMRPILAQYAQQKLATVGVKLTIDQILATTKESFVAGFHALMEAGLLDAADMLLGLSDTFLKLMPATDEANESLKELERTLQDLGRGIFEYVRDLRATRAGTAAPWMLLEGQRSNYITDLSAARGNDLDALRRIQSSASAYIEAQKGMTASGPQTQAVIDQVIAELSALPAAKSYEAQSLEALGAIKAAIDGLPAGLGQQLAGLVGRIDANGDGMVSEVERSNALLAGLPMQLASALAPHFAAIDLDFSGGITAAELRASGLATEATAQQMMFVLDANGDGQITKLELLGSKADGTNTALEALLQRIGTDSLLAYKAADIGAQFAAINYQTGLTAEWARLTEVQVFQQGQAVVAAINGLRLTATAGGSISLGGSGAGVGGSSAGLGGGTGAGTGTGGGGSTFTAFVGSARAVGGQGGVIANAAGNTIMDTPQFYDLLSQALSGGVAQQKIDLLKSVGIDHALVSTVMGWYGDSRMWPQYESGTPFVPETGPAFLHRGERVVTAGDNASMDARLAALEAAAVRSADATERLLTHSVFTGGRALEAQQKTAAGVTELASRKPLERPTVVGVVRE